jgi:shikimate 5-dehydrogenase
MQPSELKPADRPTFYFVGVTTAGSSIMTVFPAWARHVGLGDCPIVGIDCRWHDAPEAYRQVVSFLKGDPLSLGGLVTTHKLDLLAAARDLFDELDPYAELLGEVRSTPRLQNMKRIHARIKCGIEVTYHHCPAPADNNRIVNRLPPGSLVANATGLGKDAPGSPITDAARLPDGGLAWEFNYRGDLVFLRQAEAQAAARRLHVEDGWAYFVHGWTRVIAEVFGVPLPVRGPAFDRQSLYIPDDRRDARCHPRERPPRLRHARLLRRRSGA